MCIRDRLKDKDENLSGADVREGLICVISVKLQEAEFEGQTKAKLGNTEIRTLVSNMVYAKLMEFFLSLIHISAKPRSWCRAVP